MNNLNPKALGLSFGILWGVTCGFLALIDMHIGYGSELLQFLSTLYIGYDASLYGALIGLAWGFFDGLICGALLGWLYNKLN